MMVRNKIRSLWAQLTLLVVDDDGMSTVEYSNVKDYNAAICGILAVVNARARQSPTSSAPPRSGG
jgi:hypothetical protein